MAHLDRIAISPCDLLGPEADGKGEADPALAQQGEELRHELLHPLQAECAVLVEERLVDGPQAPPPASQPRRGSWRRPAPRRLGTVDWSVFGSVGYDWNDHFGVTAGYRTLGVDHPKGGFAYDSKQSGLLMGVNLGY